MAQLELAKYMQEDMLKKAFNFFDKVLFRVRNGSRTTMDRSRCRNCATFSALSLRRLRWR